MGPKLINCCKPGTDGHQEYGKMLKIIQTLEDGRIPAEAQNWRFEGRTKRITRKEYQRLVNKFEMEVFMEQKGLWNLAREKILRERGALPKTMQQEREEVYAALKYAARFHCLVEEWKDCDEQTKKKKEKCFFVDQKRDEMRHRTEWYAEAEWYRCMWCGRGSKYTKMPGKCTGLKNLSIFCGKWRRRYLLVTIGFEEWTDREKF